MDADHRHFPGSKPTGTRGSHPAPRGFTRVHHDFGGFQEDHVTPPHHLNELLHSLPNTSICEALASGLLAPWAKPYGPSVVLPSSGAWTAHWGSV